MSRRADGRFASGGVLTQLLASPVFRAKAVSGTDGVTRFPEVSVRCSKNHFITSMALVQSGMEPWKLVFSAPDRVLGSEGIEEEDWQDQEDDFTDPGDQDGDPYRVKFWCRECPYEDARPMREDKIIQRYAEALLRTPRPVKWFKI